MTTITLRKPTVKEMIAALQSLPPDAPLVLHDAGTDGLFDVIHIGPDSEHVWEKGSPDVMSIWVDYHER